MLHVDNISNPTHECARWSQAVLRTCDCLGIQHVWLVGGTADAAAPEADAAGSPAGAAAGGAPGSAANEAARWLSVRRFQSTAECVAALREEPGGTEIWATDLAQSAERLDVLLRRCGAWRGGMGAAGGGGMPARVALVFGGSEAEGVSKEMLLAADRRIYLPLHGGSFAQTLNPSLVRWCSVSALVCL